MFSVFIAVIRRDLTLAMRNRSGFLTVLFFYVVVVSLFPLSIGPDVELLRLIAPGVVWVAALLASMLALEHLFASDFADGTLEQMLLSSHPLSLLVLAKIAAHWIVTGVPLVLMSPVLGVQYDLNTEIQKVLVLALLLGTPSLSLIGAIGAALTLGLRGGGVLVSLLGLPLTIPVLIFGAGAVEASASGLGARGHLLMLGAILVFALILSPVATAVALRVSSE